MNDIEWVFLDLGWTLIDEAKPHRDRMVRVSDLIAGLGRRHTPDDLNRRCEVAAADFAPSPFLAMLHGLGLSKDQIDVVRTAAPFDPDAAIPYPGVPELLATLARSFRLGVIANQFRGTDDRLRRWGMRDHFSLVCASAELGLAKPDPSIFEHAATRAGCAPERAVMVGDRLDNDIGPAKSLGWRTIRIRQGLSRLQQPRGPHEIAEITIDSIEDLPLQFTPTP